MAGSNVITLTPELIVSRRMTSENTRTQCLLMMMIALSVTIDCHFPTHIVNSSIFVQQRYFSPPYDCRISSGVSLKIFALCLSIKSKLTICVRKNDGSIVITLIPVPINSRLNMSENIPALATFMIRPLDRRNNGIQDLVTRTTPKMLTSNTLR
ncbi:hypothetical protein DERF_014753 [Dermatophagoides farinae]|uniref:Uncharacterized protein n=1 Tax=Dermatophagoides farinae TaxID=6954 RepID=A0A922KXE6_DERFA|nr:hypothetical protein DERF_014753 [Dermatophagoides farinae]